MDPASPELKALLLRCREAPADDMPRLVLADWLDEQGDSDRATFIRVQIALSHPSADVACHGELKALEAGLLEARSEEWLGELRPILNGLRYGREIRLGMTPFAPRSAPIGRSWDLTLQRGLIRLRQFDPSWLLDPGLQSWMRTPAGDWLEQVSLTGMSPDTFERLAIPPECAGRIHLTLFLKLGQAFVESTPLGPGRITQQVEVSPSAWRRMFHCPNFASVRSLSAEAGLPFLRELGQADVSRLVELEFRRLADGTDVARVLATIPFESLSSLDFGPVTPAGVHAIIASPFLRNLAEWNLVGSPIEDTGMIALCESPLANSLTSVSFPNTGIGDAGLRALVASPIFTRMNSPSLNLMMNHIGDDGLRALAESEHLLRYRELILRENRCGDRGVAALAQSEFAANLTYLDFWRNAIGDPGAVALSESPYLNRIVDLCVKENAVGTDGAAALFEKFADRAKV